MNYMYHQCSNLLYRRERGGGGDLFIQPADRNKEDYTGATSMIS